MTGCSRRLRIAGVISLAAFAAGLAHSAAAATAADAPPPLREVVLLSDPAQFAHAGLPAPAAPGVDASRAPAISQAEAARLIGPDLGKPVDIALLTAIRTQLQNHFVSIHRPFVAVTVPPQIIDSGVVQVVIVESKLGKVTVVGNKWFGAGQYQDAIRTRPGMSIDSTRLDAGAAAINGNPYRQATIVATPGAVFGTTDLVIRTQDRRPLAFNLGFDNTGNQSTGMYRLSAGVDWGDAFGRGDDLNYQFTASPDISELRQHQLTYTGALPWLDSLSLTGSYATSHSDREAITGTSGVTGVASVRYNHPLPAWSGVRQSLSLGYDFKSTNNNILFGGESVFPTTSEIDQFIVQYSGHRDDKLGGTSVTLILTVSPGGVTTLNSDAAFAAQQPGATADYVFGHIEIDRLTSLPRGAAWSSTLTAQLSDAILLPSEQLAFGGVHSVRGFVEQGVTRDDGVLWQNELRAPPVQTGLARALRLRPGSDALTAFWFVDAAAGRNQRDLAGGVRSSVALVSTGPGMTWQLSRYASARFSYGIPVVRHGAVGPLLGPQFGVSATF